MNSNFVFTMYTIRIQTYGAIRSGVGWKDADFLWNIYTIEKQPLLSHVRLKTFYFNVNVYFVFQFKFQWTNKKFLVSEARKGREMLNLHQFYIFPTISIKICCVHNFYWQNESQINQLKFKFVLVQIYVFSNFEKLRLFNSLKII